MGMEIHAHQELFVPCLGKNNRKKRGVKKEKS